MRVSKGGNVKISFALRGAGGEPVDFIRSIRSHGCASLPPATITDDHTRYETAFRLGDRVIAVQCTAQNGNLVVTTQATLDTAETSTLKASVRRMFRLDEDLTPFYNRIADDPLLGWATSGAGRLLAKPTVFEDVLTTLCTTNCAWSGTIRMVGALVDLGGGAFPTPQLVAATPDAWFRETARAGYRGSSMREIARRVCDGEIDLEALRDQDAIDDEQCAEQLQSLPGIGPYAAAHTMLLIGRNRPLILDSWTRPTYIAKAKKKRASDTTIRRAFARYGEYAGLAFWLYLTHDWVTVSSE